MRYQFGQMVLLLGSNIHPEINIPQSIDLLTAGFPILNIASVWETPAVGSDGPDFLNTAVVLQSTLSPQSMKNFALRPIEALLGRSRTQDKNAPRTIDLDVVVWGRVTWDQDIWHHAHAAIPVAELVPDLRHPSSRKTLSQVANNLHNETPIRLQGGMTHRIHSQRVRADQATTFSQGLPLSFS